MPDLNPVDTPPPLEYGRQTRGVSRRTVRLIIGGIALLAILLVSRAIVESNQARQLWWLHVQHELMTFTAPAEQITYDEDPEKCLELLKGADYRRSTFPVAGLDQPLSLPVMFQPQFMDDDSHGFSGLQANNFPFVFMHERYSPSGHRRLVKIVTSPGSTGDAWNGHRHIKELIVPNGQRMVPIGYNIYTPLDWHVGSTATTVSFNPPCIEIGITDSWRMYAGQADAADPTHFTIGYAINGQRGTIEGWLCDNDGLRFRLVDGPATTRPVENFSH